MSAIPTPLDVALRRHPLITPAPHDPTADEPFLQLYERGITGSKLHRNTKLVALTLAAHAAWETGDIPPGAQPHLAGLVEETRLLEAQVVLALTTLAQRGWLSRANRRERWDTADVRLTIPSAIMRCLKTRS